MPVFLALETLTLSLEFLFLALFSLFSDFLFLILNTVTVFVVPLSFLPAQLFLR